MLSFNNSNRLDASFPVLMKRDILDKATIPEILSEFPSDNFFQKTETVMGGRRRIVSDNDTFYEFLQTSSHWQTLYNFINSQVFIDHVLDVFKNDIESLNPAIDLGKFRLNTNYFRNISRLKKLLPAPLAKLITKIGDKTWGRNQLFVHIDISSAADGYTREIHRDTNQRIAVILLQLSNAEDTGGTGGEFGVHSYSSPPESIQDFAIQPSPELMKTDALIASKCNTGLLFLSTHNSYHSVPAIENASGWRNFVYAGISMRNKRHWQSFR